MKYALMFFFIFISSPALAGPEDIEPAISKLEFQGVHIGDFPSVEMVCIRGLCPVGTLGVGINTNSLIPPTYIKEIAITNYNRVKISTPEYSYIDDKMFQVQFKIDCRSQGQQECMDAVKSGLDAEYGLTLLHASGGDERSSRALGSFRTEAGSLVLIVWDENGKKGYSPFVRIFDETLMDVARTSINPDYPSQVAERAKQAARKQ